MPHLPRATLDLQLDQLAAHLPELIADTRPECVMEAFAGIADEILEHASPEDCPHVDARINCMLHMAGLSPAMKRNLAMSPEQLEERLEALARELGEWSTARAGRTPREFGTWFWHRADDIKAEAGPELAELANDRIADIADSALDAGLFGTEANEDKPFPE